MSPSFLADARALETARRASLIVLDIDGVLVDPRPSFYAAAGETAAWGASRVLDRPVNPPIDAADIRAFKEIGGWNDDFDLACACTWGLLVREAGTPALPLPEFAQRVGGGLVPLARVAEQLLPNALFDRATQTLPTRLVRERAAVRYAGRARCLDLYGIEPDGFPDLPIEGLWMNEPLLCEPASLALLGGPFALFTGRNGAEAELVLDRLDLFVAPELRAVDDGETPRKPAPDALLKLAARTAGPLVFVGDSIDDERAAQTYHALAVFRPLPELIFVRIVDGNLDEAGSRAPIVASSLNALAQALRADAKEQIG